MATQSQNGVDPIPTIKPLIALGVKPNDSFFNNTMRLVVALILLVAILVLFYFSTRACPKVITMKDIENVIKPGTRLHKAIDDMDYVEQQQYISAVYKSLHSTPEKSKAIKIYKSILIALIAGSITEYIISANVSKSVGLIGKTAVLTAISTMCS